MKKILLCVFMLVSSVFVFSDDAPFQMSTLTVTVVNIKSDKGVILAALCNSRESYEGSAAAFMGCSQTVANGRSVLVFEDLPAGEYAIKLVHDKNGNGKMDTGLFGIPKEDYAFSNNVPGPLGPPDFDKVKFSVDGDTALEIRL